jgi:hypothetical protein
LNVERKTQNKQKNIKEVMDDNKTASEVRKKSLDLKKSRKTFRESPKKENVLDKAWHHLIRR